MTRSFAHHAVGLVVADNCDSNECHRLLRIIQTSDRASLRRDLLVEWANTVRRESRKNGSVYSALVNKAQTAELSRAGVVLEYLRTQCQVDGGPSRVSRDLDGVLRDIVGRLEIRVDFLEQLRERARIEMAEATSAPSSGGGSYGGGGMVLGAPSEAPTSNISTRTSTSTSTGSNNGSDGDVVLASSAEGVEVEAEALAAGPSTNIVTAPCDATNSRGDHCRDDDPEAGHDGATAAAVAAIVSSPLAMAEEICADHGRCMSASTKKVSEFACLSRVVADRAVQILYEPPNMCNTKKTNRPKDEHEKAVLLHS